DDAVIGSVADVLEAKYRVDQAAKHYLRGLPEDPDVFHDGVELAFRTWRDALTLSLRAQRALLHTARHLTGSAPRRPAPTSRIDGPIRMEFRGAGWQGRMTVRNDRATTLTATLEARLPDQPAVGFVFTPSTLRLRSGETTVVIIKL